MTGFAAVVLAGGRARRMGGVDKPRLAVAGRPMRDRVLDAVVDAVPRILVGPAEGVPADVLVTREDPPGGGPVAAVAAGLALLPATGTTVALLAADLPLLTGSTVVALRDRLAESGSDGVCYLDESGRRQSLCGVWRVPALRAALDRLAVGRATLAGLSMRALLGELCVADVAWSGTGPPPWFDCDTEDDLRRAHEWASSIERARE